MANGASLKSFSKDGGEPPEPGRTGKHDFRGETCCHRRSVVRIRDAPGMRMDFAMAFRLVDDREAPHLQTGRTPVGNARLGRRQPCPSLEGMSEGTDFLESQQPSDMGNR